MARSFLYSGRKLYQWKCCGVQYEWEKVAITEDTAARVLVGSFPGTSYITTGTPEEFGIRVPDATVIKRDPAIDQHFTIHAEEFTEKSLGAFATSTIGTFIVTAIKSDSNRASPQFFLSMIGVALWCIGLFLHVYGLVNVQRRAWVAATIMSYLVSVVVVVNVSFTPTNTGATTTS